MKTSTALPPGLRTHAYTVRDSREAGISEKRLRGRDLDHPFHGVVTARRSASIHDRCVAYSPLLPRTGFFSGSTAAILHGVPVDRVTDRLHVSVAAPQRAPRARGIVGHSVQVCAGDVVVGHGLPRSSVERMWCELSATLSLEDLVVAGDQLVRSRHPLTTVESLRRAAERYAARRGRATLHTALGLLEPLSESPQESRLRLRLAQGGIVGFCANQSIRTTAGRRYRGDLVFADDRVILEYQGDHHRDPGQFRRDLSRQLDLQADGWTVVQLGPWDLADPGLVRRIGAILAGSRLMARGRPPSHPLPGSRSASRPALRAASAPAPRR